MYIQQIYYHQQKTNPNNKLLNIYVHRIFSMYLKIIGNLSYLLYVHIIRSFYIPFFSETRLDAKKDWYTSGK